MNEYRLALDALRERRKGKPGELLLLAGLILIIAAPFALFMMGLSDAKLAALRTDGVVAEATVRNKAVLSESYTDRKGRQKSRVVRTLDLRHDLNAEQRYSDWKTGKAFAKPQYPAVTTTSIEVGESYFDALAVGERTTVVRNPSNYKSMMLIQQLEYETSFAYRLWWYLGAGIAVLVGLAMTVTGWRKRFPRG